MDRPYRWHAAHATQNQYSMGHHVTTLHINVDVEEGDWQELVMAATTGFQAVSGHAPRACLAGGSMVFLSGHVAGLCPQGHDTDREPDLAPASIARLPEALRPTRTLVFAAVSRDRADELVALVVRPDGWIQGFGRGQAPGVIDLSAVRFGIDRGIALVDEVRMHTCDFSGIRMIMLQGHLATRAFKVHTETRLGLLPKPCRPAAGELFVTAGTRAGNFHLVLVEPSKAYGAGGEITWADALWRHADEVNLSGIVYTAAAEALQLSMDAASEVSHNRRVIVLTEFQHYIKLKYGSIEGAWHNAFDTDGNGQINFTEFGFGCKAAGYPGNVSRVWDLLDVDRSGEITMNELDVVVPEPEVTRRIE